MPDWIDQLTRLGCTIAKRPFRGQVFASIDDQGRPFSLQASDGWLCYWPAGVHGKEPPSPAGDWVPVARCFPVEDCSAPNPPAPEQDPRLAALEAVGCVLLGDSAAGTIAARDPQGRALSIDLAGERFIYRCQREERHPAFTPGLAYPLDLLAEVLENTPAPPAPRAEAADEPPRERKSGDSPPSGDGNDARNLERQLVQRTMF